MCDVLPMVTMMWCVVNSSWCVGMHDECVYCGHDDECGHVVVGGNELCEYVDD